MGGRLRGCQRPSRPGPLSPCDIAEMPLPPIDVAAATLHWPGTFLEAHGKDPQDALSTQVHSLLRLMESTLVEAGLALAFYEAAASEKRACAFHERTLYTRVKAMHARSFLLSLETLHKACLTLQRLSPSPGVTDALARFEAAVPALPGVRNSASHREDRVRGMGVPRNKKDVPIQLKDGVLMTDVIVDGSYGGTLADGTVGTVEISRQGLVAAQQLAQAAICAQAWTGHPRSSL
jgi:hypothetical protein